MTEDTKRCSRVGPYPTQDHLELRLPPIVEAELLTNNVLPLMYTSDDWTNTAPADFANGDESVNNGVLPSVCISLRLVAQNMLKWYDVIPIA